MLMQRKGYKKYMTVKKGLAGSCCAAAVLLCTGCREIEDIREVTANETEETQNFTETIDLENPDNNLDQNSQQEILLPMKTLDGQWGYINLEEEMVIFPQYDEAGAFTEEGYAYVRIGNTAGYIDKTGEWVIGPKYINDYFQFEKISNLFVNKEAIVRAGLEALSPQIVQICGMFGTVGMDGTVQIPFQYQSLEPISGTEDRMIFSVLDESTNTETSESKLYGMVDEMGREIVPAEYQFIDSKMVADRIAFKKDNLCGYFDKDGKVIIEPIYNFPVGFLECGVIVQKKGEEYCILDSNGNEIQPIPFSNYVNTFCEWEEEKKEDFEEIYFLYDMEGKVRIYNATRKELLPDSYDEMNNTMVGIDFLVMRKAEKCGVVNYRGEVMIEFEYKGIFLPDKEGAILVRNLDDKWGMLNLEGDTLIDFQYDDVWPYDYNYPDLAMVEKQGKYGYCDREGKLVIPTKYQFPMIEIEEIPQILAEKLKEQSTSNREVALLMCMDNNLLSIYDQDYRLLYETKDAQFELDSIETMNKEEEEAFLMEILDEMLQKVGISVSQEELKELGNEWNEMKPAEYKNYVLVSDDLGNQIYCDGETQLYGLMNAEHEIIVKPVYDNMSLSDISGIYITAKQEEDYTHGVICITDGNIFEIPPVYDTVKVQENEVIVCVKKETSILRNRYGEWIVSSVEDKSIDNWE